jgi:predicted transposase YdaD
MAVLRESPWYQEILREGERLGEQRGRQAGREEGREEEGRSLILKFLTRQVGEALSIDQLEALGETLLDFTQPQELTNWLARNA